MIKKSSAFSIVLLATALSASFSASAGFVEVGAEFRDFSTNYETESWFRPYTKWMVNPIEGSPFKVIGRMDYRHYDLPAQRQWGNHARQELYVGYRWKFDDFVFAPKVGFRHASFSNDSRVTEYRVYPNMRYKINSTFSVAIDGFLAPVDVKGVPRMGKAELNEVGINKKVDRVNYSDYTHEIDFILSTKLAKDKRLLASIYSETYRKGKEGRDAKNKQVEALELRLAYSQNFGDLRVSPYTYIDISRDIESADGVKREGLRQRYGVEAAYKLTEKLAFQTRIFYQTEEVEDREHVKQDDKNYMNYKASFKYSF
ncbi:hypothetical protein L4D76_09985 [Photobacterium sagamiensis]|uniref:hypothetical protein n=1 Tax=Photobacterium sagamiensis TaxID=2910241 RepID=UPI003D0B5B68